MFCIENLNSTQRAFFNGGCIYGNAGFALTKGSNLVGIASGQLGVGCQPVYTSAYEYTPWITKVTGIQFN